MSRWISCVRPPILPLTDSRSGPLGGRPRQHRVLGGDPAGPLAAQVRRDAVRRSSPRTGPRCRRSGSRHEPSAHFWTPSVKLIGRRSRRRAPVGADGWRPVADGHDGPLLSLGGIPQRIERIEVEVAQGDALGGGAALDARESAAELGVGRADRGLRLDPAAAGDVDEHEQQVAELLGRTRRRWRPRGARRPPRRPCRGRPSTVGQS